MRKLIFVFISIALLQSITFSARATWYEVTGEANILSSENDARSVALADALYKAVDFAGGDIGGLSALKPYLKQNRDQYQFSNHEVRYISIESSRISGNKLYLTTRVDIYPSATTCHTSQYKKTILVGNISIDSPQQAVIGQIYNLGDDFSKVLDRQIAQQSQSFVSVGTTDYEMNKHYPQRIKMIAGDTGAQYLIGGKIIDLTATISSSSSQTEVINRQFALEVHVYDGKTGHEISKKVYREVANWPFAKTSQVDTQSARFWASTYGEMVLRVSRDVMLDLEAGLSCKITLPEVVAINQEITTINLGRLHGVKKGDKLRLWHTASFIDQHGLARSKVTRSDITLTVTRVYDKEAEAKIDQPDLAASVQIGDVMDKFQPQQQ